MSGRLELVITCFCLDNVSYSIHHSFAYNAFGNTEFSGMWDAVVTCFFIDTAHNIIEYIETISKILKDGGVNYLC